MKYIMRLGLVAIAISSLVCITSCDLDSKVVVLSQNNNSTSSNKNEIKKDTNDEIDTTNFVL